mgnify:CR=1 FL=1
MIPSTWSRVTVRDSNQRERRDGLSRGADRLAGKRRLDLHRHQPLIAQTIDDLGFVRRVELAGGDIARGVYRAVSEKRHLSRDPSSRA